jgi:hypothetical protein
MKAALFWPPAARVAPVDELAEFVFPALLAPAA